MQLKKIFSIFFSAFRVLCIFCLYSIYSQNTVPSYTIDALISPQTEAINVNQKMRFIAPNTEDNKIVYLYDWSNSFKNTNTPLSLQLADEFDRSFYLSNKNKRGFTKISSIYLDSIPLVWQRLKDQPDIIKVFLFGHTDKDKPLQLDLNYQIKIPDQKFTGFGIDGNGEIKLRNWFIALAPFIDNHWLLHSNLNLEDNSHLPADFEISWKYPKEYFVESNLIKEKSTINGNTEIIYFTGEKQTRAQFVFTKNNSFETFDFGQGKSVVTDMLNNNENVGLYKNSIDRIKQFTSDYLKPYPHDKELILTLDFNKNPFYGLNQLPSFLKLFSDHFFFEIKFLKTYLNNYLNEVLAIDKRKDHWVFYGIQTYLMIKYVEKYYPDQKFIGSLADIKLLKNYTFSDITFNTGYLFFYETFLRANYQQNDFMSKEKLTKFNQKIGSPYHSGIGLRYLESYVGEKVFQKSLKSFINGSPIKSLESELKQETSVPLDWFFNGYLKKRQPFELIVKEITKVGDSIKIAVSEKNKRPVPVQIAAVKNDSVVSSKWIYLDQKTSTTNLKVRNANYIAINPNSELPEWNRKNNWVYLKGKSNFKPLKIKLVKDIENPKLRQLFFNPVMNFNFYDGLSPGFNLKNKKLKSQPFELEIQPQFGLREKAWIGFFKTSFRKYHENKKKYLTQYSIFGSSYHYNSNLRYSVFVPSISFFYRDSDLRSNKRQALNLSLYNVQRENEPEINTSPDYQVLNLSYTFSNKGSVRYFTSNSNLEISDQFGKIHGSLDYRKLFPSGRQFAFRLFAGKFLWQQPTESTFFNFNLNRPNDYLFRYSYLGRSETTGFYSQQFVTAEGGFKSKFEESTSNDYMLTLNAFMGIWKWVEFYGDIGLLKNKNKKTIGYFDSGIRLNLVPDYLELYFPIGSSNGWEITDRKYSSKIRFVLSLRSNAIKNLFTRNWF